MSRCEVYWQKDNGPEGTVAMSARTRERKIRGGLGRVWEGGMGGWDGRWTDGQKSGRVLVCTVSTAWEQFGMFASLRLHKTY